VRSAAEPGAICRVEELGEGQARGFERRDSEGSAFGIFIVRYAGRFFAYLNRCPHRGTPLDLLPDHFLDGARQNVVCATHGAVFRIEDGVCTQGPCAGDALTPYVVEVRDGWLFDVA